MNSPVYSKVIRVWLVQTRRKIGSIPAGSFVTNVWGFKRSDARISDWLANSGISRRHVRLVGGFVPVNITNAIVNLSRQ